MEETSLYNIAIIKSFAEYISKYHPQLDMVPILDYAGITPYQLADEGHWLTQTQVDRFYEILVKTLGDPDIARKAGQYAPFSKAAGNVSQYILGFITPSAAYTSLSNYYPRASKSSTLKTRKVSSNQVEVIAIQNPDVTEKPYQCENRLGMFEGIAKLFTNELAKIEHTTCMHISGDRCIYNITWKTSPSFIWKRIVNFSYVLCLIISLFLFFALPGGYSVIAILSTILVVMGISLYQVYLEKNELATTFKNHGNTASNLLDEINARYNNAMLVQEIGQAASNILDIDNLLKFTMETIGKRLDFDRGLIMLANKDRTRLVYKVGYGYNRDEETLLINTEFHLDNPKSRGPFIVSFKQQKPFLINNFNDIEKDVSERSREFVKKVNVKSFICVPIIYEGRSEGILAVDNQRSNRPLTQSDINLFLGIAPQLGISINNARSYELIRERESRFRALSENAPDIIYTLNADGKFSYVNPAWERILGHRKEDVIGKKLTDFTKKEDLGIFDFKEIMDRRKRVYGQYGSILHKDGSERLFNMSGAPNKDSGGNIVGIVGTFRDVTDLKKSEAELQRSYAMLQTAMSSTIDAISIIAESRDPYTAGHQKRVADLAVAIARELGFSDEKIDFIRMGSLIHDIGKIHIPSEILTRPARLNEIEFSMIKTHATVGHDILKKVDFIPVITAMVYQHHERMDGSGYPNGIKGNEILLEARILAVADTVEAMASHRPYRASLGINAALDKIKKSRGDLYDSDAVDACLRLFEKKSFKFRKD